MKPHPRRRDYHDPKKQRNCDESWYAQEKTSDSNLFIQALLVHSLEEAIQTADSMKARGYGKGKRIHTNITILKRVIGLWDFI